MRLGLGLGVNRNNRGAFGAPVTGLSSTVEVNRTVTLDWTDAADATEYIIKRDGVEIDRVLQGVETFNDPFDGAELAVTGSVVDDADDPVEGLTVQLIDGNEDVVDTDTTNVSGEFDLTAAEAGVHTVRVHAPLAFCCDDESVTVNGAQSAVDIALTPAIHSDDFQGYAAIAAITYGSNGGHTPTIGKFGYNPGVVDFVNVAGAVIGDYALDATGGPFGGKALRYNWPAQPGNVSNYYIAMQFRINPLPAIGSSLYLRWTTKESDGFRVGGGGALGSSCEYKFLFADIVPPGEASGFLQVELENLTSSPSDAVSLRAKLIDGTTYGAPWNGSPTSEVAHGGPGDSVLTGWDGAFHTWVAAITNLNTPAQTLTIYKDGVAFLTLEDAPFYPNVDMSGGLLTIEMGANINNGPDLAQSRWWSEIGVYAKRPSLLAQAA